MSAKKTCRVKRIAVLGLLVLFLSSAGCLGPMHAMRGLDDWTNQAYVDKPVGVQLLVVTGIIPVFYVVSATVDFLIINPIDFLGSALWEGTGDPYLHRNPSVPEPR